MLLFCSNAPPSALFHFVVVYLSIVQKYLLYLLLLICEFEFVAVEVEGERIVSVTKRSEAPKSLSGGPRVLDYGSAVIMPGLIDAYDRPYISVNPSI